MLAGGFFNAVGFHGLHQLGLDIGNLALELLEPGLESPLLLTQ